jgi:hypothetical protein
MMVVLSFLLGLIDWDVSIGTLELLPVVRVWGCYMGSVGRLPHLFLWLRASFPQLSVRWWTIDISMLSL